MGTCSRTLVQCPFVGESVYDPNCIHRYEKSKKLKGFSNLEISPYKALFIGKYILYIWIDVKRMEFF